MPLESEMLLNIYPGYIFCIRATSYDHTFFFFFFPGWLVYCAAQHSPSPGTAAPSSLGPGIAEGSATNAVDFVFQVSLAHRLQYISHILTCEVRAYYYQSDRAKSTLLVLVIVWRLAVLLGTYS